MSQVTNADITLVFSVHRVLQVCNTLTKLCILCKSIATAYENLVKHLKLVIRQLVDLQDKTESVVDEEELLDLVDTINGLALSVVSLSVVD